MKLIKSPFFVYVIAGYMLLLNTSSAMAGMVSSTLSVDKIEIQQDREAQIETIRKALENKQVREKLLGHGLTAEEVDAKLSQMNEQQIHMLASASDKVLAGGDIITILIIVILVILIIRLV